MGDKLLYNIFKFDDYNILISEMIVDLTGVGIEAESEKKILKGY